MPNSDTEHNKTIKFDIERSRRSRWFNKEERFWEKDLKRLLKLIHCHVDTIKALRESGDPAWLSSAPTLTLAIFGPSGSGKSSLLKTLVHEAQKESGRKDSFQKISSLDILRPTSFGKNDQLIYSVVAASLDAHRKKQGDNYDFDYLTPVLKAYRELSDHLRVIHDEEYDNDYEPHALAAQVVQRHTSGLRLMDHLDLFFNCLADDLGQSQDSVILVPVDDLDLTPSHLLPGLRQLENYLLHPRLVPVFCFTDRLAEEILADAFAKNISFADSERKMAGRLSVSEQLAVHFLSKCFPIRNRIRLGPNSAVLQGGNLKESYFSTQNEPVLLSLATASVLLFGVQDRNARHPVVAALRPATLRRQLQVLDALREVGVDGLINRQIANLVQVELPNKPREPKHSWAEIFDRAAWSLFNVHRDVLRENGMHLEDLYTYTPHALQRFLLENLFHLPDLSQAALWQRWRSFTDSRRSQVISLFAANAYRPWFNSEQASGEDHQQILSVPFESNVNSENDTNSENNTNMNMKIKAPLALLWFLDLAVNFYLPFGRSVYRQLTALDKRHKQKEPLSGAGWSFHSGPIHAAVAADDDHKPFPTGMMFLDPLSFAISLTTVPRIAACRVLDDEAPHGSEVWKVIKKAKQAFLGIPTNEILPCIEEVLSRKAETGMSSKNHLVPLQIKFGDHDRIFENALKKYRTVANWEIGVNEDSEHPHLGGLEISDSISNSLKKHHYEKAKVEAEKIEDLNTKEGVIQIIKGLNAAANAVHDDQLLLRIWTCYGYNRGRFWAAASIWRGLGLMGQLIESYRRWEIQYEKEKALFNKESSKAATGRKSNFPEKKKFITKKIAGILHTHSLRGLVPGKNLGEPANKGNLDLAFSSWNTRGQRQAIRRLAMRLESWLSNSNSLEISPLQRCGENFGDELSNLRWNACFIRRLHGASMVGALWQWLDAELLEYQGRQYGQPRHYRWNAGIAITSWLRVLQRYFERSHEIRWLIETCPLTGPFLSRTPNDPFLTKLRKKSYDEVLKVVQEDGANQPENTTPIRLGTRFRAITKCLQRLWDDGPDVDRELKEKIAPLIEAGITGKNRNEWEKNVSEKLIELLNLDPDAEDNSQYKKWKGYFEEECGKDFERIVGVASKVRKEVWTDPPKEDPEEDIDLKRYQESLLNSFKPRISTQNEMGSENPNQVGDEEFDLIDPQSASFEMASMIQQYWKVSAHASAASLFYQIPRVDLDDFLEDEPMPTGTKPGPSSPKSPGSCPEGQDSGSSALPESE